MGLFGKKTKQIPLPEGFTAQDIRTESSICTGERTIGFYSASEKKIFYAELVRCDEDIDRFYEKYGIARDER